MARPHHFEPPSHFSQPIPHSPNAGFNPKAFFEPLTGVFATPKTFLGYLLTKFLLGSRVQATPGSRRLALPSAELLNSGEIRAKNRGRLRRFSVPDVRIRAEPESRSPTVEASIARRSGEQKQLMSDPETKAAIGRDAAKPAEIPAKGWWQVLLRTKAEIKNDNLSVIAAGVAFYAFLSIPAVLTATVALWGLVSDPAGIQAQIGELAGVLPGQVQDILVDQLTAISENSDSALGWTVFLSIGFALWSASKGTKSAIVAMNVAYEEEEQRGFVKLTATTLALTLGAVLTVIVALFCVAGIPALVGSLSLPGWIETTAGIARWPLLAGVSLLALAILYRVAPCRNSPKWRWTTPGSLIATLLWLGASAGFSWYVSSSAKYNETYGSLGGVVVLLMWLYLSAFIILLGGELNSELEHQTVVDTTVGPPEPLGERDAQMADTVAPKD